jgi:hypothetical protein
MYNGIIETINGVQMMSWITLQQKALKTHDSAELFKIIEEAIDQIKFNEAQVAFLRKKINDLQAQVERQKKMLEAFDD